MVIIMVIIIGSLVSNLKNNNELNIRKTSKIVDPSEAELYPSKLKLLEAVLRFRIVTG